MDKNAEKMIFCNWKLAIFASILNAKKEVFEDKAGKVKTKPLLFEACLCKAFSASFTCKYHFPSLFP